MSSYLVEHLDYQLSRLKNDNNAFCEFGVKVEAMGADKKLSDLSPLLLRQLVVENQLVVLSGFVSENSIESLTHFCECIGQIMMWPFGAVLDLIEQPDAVDHIFANSYVPLHWDGMYLETVPELQVFQCVSQGGAETGGRTTFSSTTVALEHASDELRKFWEVSVGQYKRQVKLYGSTVKAPIIESHPYNGKKVLRFCEPPLEGDKDFLNPSIYHFFVQSDQSQSVELVESLRKALYDPLAHYAHSWNQGDVVIADNFSLLHGREAFQKNSGRHVRRVHIHAQDVFKNPHLVEQ